MSSRSVKSNTLPTKTKLGIAVIIALSVIILATVVLMILDACGVLYKTDESVEIVPPQKASTNVLKDGEYSYVILKDGTAMITNSSLPADTLEITVPQTLGGYKVTAIGESAFALLTNVQTVRIPEGVTYIGKAVFFGALNAKLYLPSTLKQVDEGAMEGFDEPAGIYYAGTAEMWSEVKIGDKNAVLARVVFNEE